MVLLIYFGAVLIAVAVLCRAAVIVPTVHYGVVLRFKKRTGRVLDEGLHFVLPFIDSVELFAYEVVTASIEESFFSKDNLQVIIKGAVQWRPDQKLYDVFIERSESTISEGLTAAIKSELGIIAGTKPAAAFIKSREAISDLINCILRMNEPFHVIHQLPPPKRLKFYEENGINIRAHLREEHRLTDDRSQVEAAYGIDVMEFALADVDFTPETKKQLELKKQTEAKLKADELESKTKEKLIVKYKALGLDPQAANNAAEVTMDQAKRSIISVEGLDKLLPFRNN